jgi:tRNA threonylcarbamoyl adenosine modification protein (Sua5/YciO/YrdC/YwlC family)
VKVVAVDPAHPREDCLEAAVRVLQAGGVVALPTETFYGLACDSLNDAALARVNELKGKADDAAILLLLADLGQAAIVAREPPPSFGALAERFWPGPLTLVIGALQGLPAPVGGALGSVGVRVSGLALPRRLASRLGRPVSGPSANRHGRSPCRTAGEVVEVFGDELDLVLDGGPTPGGASSTIVDLTGPEPVVLREGLTPLSALRPFLPDPTR